MYNTPLTYQSLDGILGRINYAHIGRIGNPEGIDYLITGNIMLEELGSYNRKFGANQPIDLRSEVYFIKDKQSYAAHSDKGYNSSAIHQRYYFNPDTFLRNDRKPAMFVGDAEQVKDLVKEAFMAITDEELPENLVISLCTVEEMIDIHNTFGRWNPGILGFSFNSNGNGINHIFVRKGALDRVMVTLGHELGHIFTRTLDNGKDEEAKAFAFCFEWVKTIQENNIGNLADSINLDINPAENNLHDVTFNFVSRKVSEGIKPMQLHWDIVRRYVSLQNFITNLSH